MTLTQYANAKLNGLDDTEIAARCEITLGELQALRKSWGMTEVCKPHKLNHPPAFTAEQYRGWVAQGMTLVQIGEMHGRSAGWVTHQKSKFEREGMGV